MSAKADSLRRQPTPISALKKCGGRVRLFQRLKEEEMDRKLARKNMRFGISLFMLLLALIGAAFVWGVIYLGVVK